MTCHEATSEGQVQVEGFWLMKAESASGATISGESSTHLSDPSATAGDPILGAVPDLNDHANDFTAWPTSYTDGQPVPFPGM